MNLHLVSLGCARNQVDSEGMSGRLDAAGWRITDDPETAEVIVINTCSFIEAAADESIDTILQMARYKESGVCRMLIVAGCLPERYGAAIAGELPEVDLFLGTGAFDRIVDAACGALAADRCLLPDPDRLPEVDSAGPRILGAPHMAYLKIAEGCSRTCTYCIIPRLRGRQKSRQAADIVAEARRLVTGGVRELVLVAQDATAYGRDLSPPGDPSDLLLRLSDIADDIWIRVLYGHPESITPAMIRTIAGRSNICSYYDLPIQHASDAVLQRMGRGYSQEDLRRLFGEIRSADPDACLRTTVITGFPGETDADVAALLRFIEEIRFHHLGAFTYSDAEDLPSHGLPDPVTPAKAAKRRDRVMALQQTISAEICDTYVDRTLDVLVEERTEPGLYAGRTAFQAPEVDGVTYVRAEGLEIGRFCPVRIADAWEYDLVGDLHER